MKITEEKLAEILEHAAAHCQNEAGTQPPEEIPYWEATKREYTEIRETLLREMENTIEPV